MMTPREAFRLLGEARDRLRFAPWTAFEPEQGSAIVEAVPPASEIMHQMKTIHPGFDNGSGLFDNHWIIRKKDLPTLNVILAPVGIVPGGDGM